MKTQSPDTSFDAEQVQIAGLQNMLPAEKLQRVVELNEAVLQLARARILMKYGSDLSEREVRLRLASLWLDRETMVRAFGWDPKIEGY